MHATALILRKKRGYYKIDFPEKAMKFDEKDSRTVLNTILRTGRAGQHLLRPGYPQPYWINIDFPSLGGKMFPEL